MIKFLLKQFKFYLSLFFIFSFINNNCFCALIYAQRSGSEGRFKSFLYHKNGVYYYEGFYEMPSFIEFATNEKIATIYMPKRDAWAIKPKDNRLFLMPVGEEADTTMIIMTNLRTYFFELHAKVAKGAFDRNVAFFTKFNYPDGSENKSSSENGNDGSIIQYTFIRGPDLSKPENFNFNYTVSGDYIITPIKVFDDGQFTYFEFKEKNGVIPAIFSVDNEGNESVINFRLIDKYIAVEGVNSVYTLRHGNDTVCVFNETMRDIVRNLTTRKK